MDVKQILNVRTYKKGYHVVEYLVDGSMFGGGDYIVKSAFTNDSLEYIGDSVWAHRLTHRYGITKMESLDGNPNLKHLQDSYSKKAKDLLEGNLLKEYSFRPVCTGFDEKQKAWYGWSHRSIGRFTIGSVVKPGSIAYKPKDKDDCIREAILFWQSKHRENIRYAGDEYSDDLGCWGARIEWEYTQDVPNEKLRGTTGWVFDEYPDEWGRGAWTAKTLEDARQMARDYASEIS